MPKFEKKGEELYIDGKKVLKAWESFSGWYWFATELIEERKVNSDNGGSLINGKEVDDTIWYGLVQGLCEEWGDFSQAELESMKNQIWRIKKIDLPHSGRRH